jgi:hypothetical protein
VAVVAVAAVALINRLGYHYMAELLRTQGYRVQVSGAPSAATPAVSFGQQRRPDIAFQVQANYQQALAQSIDRMSRTAFGIAEEMGQRAGLQFSLENPLTNEQLQAMSRGDMSTVNLGSPLNVFSSAVRKARAIELSAHMEAEARNEMVSLYDRAAKGQLDTETAAGKVRGILDAGASTLSQVDPDAAYKYRAAISAMGGKVIDEIGKVELKRRALANEQKLSTDYRNVMMGISAFMSSSLPINPETGKERDLNELIDAAKANFLANAFALGGLPAMESYAARIDKDIREAKIGAVTRELTKDEYYLNPTQTINRILAGDLNDARQTMASLVATDFDAAKAVAANFRTMVSDRRQQQSDEENRAKAANNAAANTLMTEYFSPGTGVSRKREIGNQLASMNVLTPGQLERFLDPSAAKGDPYAQAAIELAIANGNITDPDQLKRHAMRAGMNGEQFLQLNRRLIQGFEQEERQSMSYLRAEAGVPDVRGAFVSGDDRHKIDKANRLQEITNQKADEFRRKNPGQPIPWMQLAREAATQYAQVDGANASKQAARRQLDNFVKGLRERNKRIAEGFTIDADTNVDDLVRAGIIKEKDADYVRKKVNALRGVSQ